MLLLVGGAIEASAQIGEDTEFDWDSEAEIIAANLLMGGISGGLAAVMRGEPVAKAFARGVGGGGVVYAGKRIAAEQAPGAGFLGRQVASVGGSIIGNAVSGRGSLDRIAFGVGPIRLYVGRDVSSGFDLRLDVMSVAAVGWGLWRGGEFDLGRSLSSGAVVLKEDDGGNAMPGFIAYSPLSGSERQSYVIAHEQIHILQYDQTFLSWGEPLETWLGQTVPWLSAPLTHLEFNLPILAATAVLGIFVWKGHDQQPWEKEAMYLARTSS